MRSIFLATLTLLLFSGCTQETQNKFGRAMQNYTGTNGVLDVYAGEKLVKRFIKVDKITTATATDSNTIRSYRYGYGYLDINQNLKVDAGEKKIYFEIGSFCTYVFYENPTQ